MTAVQKVLVVGGGIAGLSTTIGLRQAGYDVDLVERNPAWDVYGVGIIQPANALRALHVLGLAEEAVAQGCPMYGDATWLGDGTTLLADNDWPALVEGLPPANGITRPRLHRILQSHTLDSGADVRTGVTFASLHDTGDRVEVAFTDGETRSNDLVVGADGLNSEVRRMVFGDAYRPKFTGQVCWRYNLPRIESLNKIWVFLGATGTAGFCPLSEDLMYILTIEKPLIVDDDEVVYRPVENVLVPPPWYRGRVVLIGDAAHATSPHCGQGAAQAIEDSIVLTQELTRDVSLEGALGAWMERRYERCRMIVEGSEAIGRWELDHSLPIDPVATRTEVTVAAMAPFETGR